MNIPELIRRKRDRGRLTSLEMRELVDGFVAGNVTEGQMAAWLMAVCLRGMSSEETAALTDAMLKSGKTIDLSGIRRPTVGKHSTGGVGDKVSMIVGPLVAACGAVVPMISGRSLGITGGTLDKMESIPGFRVELPIDAFYRNLERVGVCIAGQSEELCPADMRMYALRNVTATVDSVPLIAASIMSKKLAEGTSALVLDVKVGSGAFMTRPAQARRLARMMIDIGTAAGRRVAALITAMWEPLGHAVGNALEVIEAIEALKGNWPSDLREVTLALAEEMLLLCGRARTKPQAVRLLMRALTQRTALTKFVEMVAAQGGNPGVVEDYALLPQARFKFPVHATASGFVRSIDSAQVGRLGIDIGVGRRKTGAKVDHAAGFVFRRKTGDAVQAGELVAEVYSTDEVGGRDAAAALAGCYTYSRARPKSVGLVMGRLGVGRRAVVGRMSGRRLRGRVIK